MVSIKVFAYHLRPLLMPGTRRKIDVLCTEAKYMDVPVKKPGIVGHSLIYGIARKIVLGFKSSFQFLKRFCNVFLMVRKIGLLRARKVFQNT